MNKKNIATKTHFEQLMEKDRWHANELGLSLSPDCSDYWFPFLKIKLYWLKEGSKKFIYQQSSTKTYNTCRSYLKALTSFGLFIANAVPNIKPNDIDRQLIIEYIHELCVTRKLKPATIQSLLYGIKYFFEINAREKWLTLPKEPLIFYDDFPSRATPLPNFIPESVIGQLIKQLPTLSESHQNLITLFLETGRRRGEIFSLAYHCLQQDEEGDYFMKVEDRKMQTTRLIPISSNCVQHVKQQQACVDKITSSKDFLFVIKRKGIIQPMKSQHINTVLNNLAKEKNIVDDDGCLWHFHFHQFRHYVEFLIMLSKPLLGLNNSVFAISTQHN